MSADFDGDTLASPDQTSGGKKKIKLTLGKEPKLVQPSGDKKTVKLRLGKEPQHIANRAEKAAAFFGVSDEPTDGKGHSGNNGPDPT